LKTHGTVPTYTTLKQFYTEHVATALIVLFSHRDDYKDPGKSQAFVCLRKQHPKI
jgi:hypothetical protein